MRYYWRRKSERGTSGRPKIDPEVIELIQHEVDKVNRTLARVENIRNFKILPKKLYEEDREVTPTMKVKRQYINRAFSDLIEEFYK